MRSKSPRARFLAAGITAALTMAACGSDDANSIDNESLTTNAPTAESRSTNPPTDETLATQAPAVEATPADAGYAYASNVDGHRLVVKDICEVKELLDAETVDYDAINALYTEGKNSVKGDGFRTLGGFASGEGKKHGLAEFYAVPAPINDFVSSAIAGTGLFAALSQDAVRTERQTSAVKTSERSLTTAVRWRTLRSSPPWCPAETRSWKVM
jgi:hypothetical protein